MLNENQIARMKLASEAIAEIASKMVDAIKSFLATFESFEESQKLEKIRPTWQAPKVISLKSQVMNRKPIGVKARSNL